MKLVLLLLITALILVSCDEYLSNNEGSSNSVGNNPPLYNRHTDKLMCDVVGQCVSCSLNDKANHEQCRATGRIVRIKCKGEEEEFDDYKSCQLTAEDEQIRVVIFQVVMAVIGGISYWAVQTRKKHTMSLFDYRKLR